MRPVDLHPLPFDGQLPDELATFPRLLEYNARHWPDAVAVRQKDLGIWQEMTWLDCLSRVRAITLGLEVLGVAAGDVVAYIGQNRADFVFAKIATNGLAALSLGLYKDSLKDEIAYLINHADVRVVFAEDEEQVDKFLDLAGAIPGVRKIVYWNPRGMRKYSDPRLISIDDLCALGDGQHSTAPMRFGQLVAETPPEAPSILVTTSGTTSHPKLVVLQSGAFLRHCLAFLEADPKGPGDDYVSVLPLPWIGEQVNALAFFLLSRIRVNFVEDESTTAHDMREIGPTSVLYPPRVWEGIAADIKARMMESTPLKRFIYNQALKMGERAATSGTQSLLARFLVGRALRDRIGLTRARSATTGGAALGHDVFRFFRAIGVPLRQVYGQTEMIGIYCGHRYDDVDFETVGQPFPGVEIRIHEPDNNALGEVVVRHPGMFTGYYRDDNASQDVVRGGWMHTGDAGYFTPRGHLVVIDRVRDLATLATGDRFSPQYVENRLKFSPFIAECVVLGQGRTYVTAMICIRYSIVSKWAEARRITFTTYSDLAGRPEVRELVRREIENTNAGLPDGVRVARFLLLYKELDADDGELTRTSKIRRGTINERYAPLIDALYSSREHIDVDTTVVLQDGRPQRIRTRVLITTLIASAMQPAEMTLVE